jgi:hypothetical protein
MIQPPILKYVLFAALLPLACIDQYYRILPDNLRLSSAALSDSTVELSWHFSGDHIIDDFLLERSRNDSLNYYHRMTISANDTQFIDSGLDQDTKYFYRIIAENITSPPCTSNIASTTTNDIVTPLIEALPSLALCVTPTYDGSGQAMHPDILFFKTKFKGYRFYLAMTPYTDSYDRVENPSLLVSNDGFHFTEPQPGLNPLTPAPPYGYNDDPDILWDQERKLFRLHYLETMLPDSQNLIRLTSADGSVWRKETAFHDTIDNAAFMLSPAFVKTPAGYSLFYVDRQTQHAYYLKSADGTTWNKNARAWLPIAINEGFKCWHLDVIPGDEWYYILVNGWIFSPGDRQPNDPTLRSQKLFIGRSRDCIAWQWQNEAILDTAEFKNNSQKIYRSTGLVFNNTLVVWFSYKKLDFRWGIAVKKFNLDELFVD